MLAHRPLRCSRQCVAHRATIVVLVLGLAPGVPPARTIAADGVAAATRYDVVEAFDVEDWNVEGIAAAADSGRPFTLRYFGAEHTLALERNPLRSERFRMTAVDRSGFRRLVPTRTKVYRGRVDGDRTSTVRLSIDARGLRGFIRSADGWTFIDPLPAAPGTARATVDGAVAHRVYSEADISLEEIGSCGAELLGASASVDSTAIEDAHAHDGHEHASSGAARPELVGLEPPRSSVATSEEPIAATAETRTMELAVVADFEYFQTHGANSLTEIEATINAVDGIYERELGLRVEIGDVTIWEDANDPYTHTDALDLLVQLRSYWNGNKTGVPRDVVHLFTGKELDDATVGIAYVGVVCSRTNGYSLSQDIQSSFLEGMLVAHEIGHALGSQHDANGSTPRYIMYASLGGLNLDEFSDQSLNAIGNYIDSVSCLAADSDDESDGANAGAGGGGRRSGGGGGPVDPLLLVGLAAACGARGLSRLRRAAR